MVNGNLIDILLDAGLIQFGYFPNPDTSTSSPLRLNFNLLPAYPMVLKVIAERVAARVHGIERILCDWHSLPLGVGVSLTTDIPLVYTQQQRDMSVHDLVGAYDIGHPSILLRNVYDDEQETARLIDQAQRVGLNVERTLCIISVIPVGEEVDSLLSIETFVHSLTQQGKLSVAQSKAILQWHSTLRRDSGSP